MGRFKHKVFIYSGGGFSGCFWEWNICFWDKDGKFHNAHSTGHDGIKDEKDALETVKLLKKNQKTGDKDYNHPLSSRINNETMLLDYTKKKDCEEIAEWCASLVQGIVKFIEETLNEDHEIYIKCHVCGKTGQDLDDFTLDDERHQGITGWHESFQCNNCRSEFSCTYCNEDYRGNEECLINKDENYSPICISCYKDMIADEIVAGTRFIKSRYDKGAILCRDKIIKMKIILEQFLGEDEEGNPVEQKEEEIADETPYLPGICKNITVPAWQID